VVIEDSPLGVQAAVAAGMTVIGYAEIVSAERLLAAGAHTTVSHLAQVPALMGLSAA
jgi:beta-phosphoglucomutase-like phosphatase (HAD superfamily)